MQCPFPGMDPYIERAAIWADFHDSLITAIRAVLQPLLRPKYAALVQDRLYVVESERPIYPDVSLVETRLPSARAASESAVVEPDQPLVFQLDVETIRQPYLTILEPAAGNRLITAIEVLSPDNKKPGKGRKTYLKKSRELLASGANLVEIDLLREGKHTLRIQEQGLARLPRWHYLAAVTRGSDRQEVYAIALEQRLPRLSLPLTPNDSDIPLDLQAVFTRCWQEGPYPELLHYDEPPPGSMTSEEIAWCIQQLQRASLKNGD